MDIELTRACGDCLASLRKARGVTQVELARRLGAPQSFVSKVETGERALKVYELFDYAEALETTASELIGTLEDALAAGRAERDQRQSKTHNGNRACTGSRCC